jgi:hypothetical protein
MTEIRDATGLSIIAGRSLLRAADLEAMPAGRDFIASLGVSRHGGLLRSLDLLARARSQGRAVIVGAQRGETSVLARAGLALATAAHPALVACEIAYGARLLEADAAMPSLGFGRYGVLDTAPFGGSPGWGLGPTPELSAALATRTPSGARSIHSA